MPRSEKVAGNLESAQDKLQLSPDVPAGAIAKLFGYYYLSLPERLQLFFVFSLSALFLFSGCIWSQSAWFKRGAIVALICMAIMLISLGYTRYLAPIEGIMVQSAELRRDAGLYYAAAAKEPLPAGSKVEVVGVSPDGSWLKLSTPGGDLGYVPQESIRLINN